MQDFYKLSFWERSHKLVLIYYKLTKNYPKEEIFGLVSQIGRSSSSIPTNIAEGCGRNSKPQLRNFLQIATGSISELQYQTLLSLELGYISKEDFSYLDSELIQIRKMIFSYSSKL